jgi:hypothetical protein
MIGDPASRPDATHTTSYIVKLPHRAPFTVAAADPDHALALALEHWDIPVEFRVEVRSQSGVYKSPTQL